MTEKRKKSGAMKIYHSSKEFPSSVRNPVVALGNFDGVHLAHQKMFQWAARQAKKIKGKTVVYTFDPHPVKILSKESAPLMINTLEQKLELIAECKVDAVILEPFDLSFAHLEGREWFEKILVKRVHASVLVAGYDFTFGTHRSGTVETLHALCEEFHMGCHILPAQLLHDALISSSQVRQFVQNGEVKRAAKLMGRPYFIDGEVIRGVGRGGTLGIRTANLKVENELIPQSGVYACQVQWLKKKFSAVTNIGINPTFGGQTLGVETHLLNFNKDIYREKLRLYFVDKIREERTFASPQDLVRQIKNDIQAAKKILKS